MNDDEFTALYDAHARRLWAYIARVSRSAATADDVVQEAFMRVYNAKALEAADPEHRRQYLYKVATNLARRERRQHEHTQALLGSELSPAEDVSGRLAVGDALDHLSDNERRTLWLSHVEGWSHREIAAMLGYREGSIRQVAVRARRRFLEVFGPRNRKAGERS